MSTGNGPSRERLEHDEALHDPTHRAVPVENLLQNLDVAHRVDAPASDRPHEPRGGYSAA